CCRAHARRLPRQVLPDHAARPVRRRIDEGARCQVALPVETHRPRSRSAIPNCVRSLKAGSSNRGRPADSDMSALRALRLEARVMCSAAQRSSDELHQPAVLQRKEEGSYVLLNLLPGCRELRCKSRNHVLQRCLAVNFCKNMHRDRVEFERPFRCKQNPPITSLVKMGPHAAKEPWSGRWRDGGGHFAMPSPGRHAPGGMRPGSTYAL